MGHEFRVFCLEKTSPEFGEKVSNHLKFGYALWNKPLEAYNGQEDDDSGFYMKKQH